VNEINTESTPLHTMNPLNRFSDRAEDYAKYRPSYPEDAIATILEGLSERSQLIAADIGAGTGISSRLLAQRGVRVIAIEPNTAMREAAEPHALLEFRDGSAEATNLPDYSVDLVTCFQAFHWFDPEPTLSEFHRILKPSGRLAIVWNDRDKQDELTQGYTQLVKIASNNHPAESRLVSIDPLLSSSLFPDVHRYTFAYRQKLDLEGLIGRVRSVSYIPREEQVQQQLISGLQELYNRYRDENGFVYMTYRTSVYLTSPQRQEL
jgi:SAM-dependent methyltransferase